jgi:hypothetical protein
MAKFNAFWNRPWEPGGQFSWCLCGQFKLLTWSQPQFHWPCTQVFTDILILCSPFVPGSRFEYSIPAGHNYVCICWHCVLLCISIWQELHWRRKLMPRCVNFQLLPYYFIAWHLHCKNFLGIWSSLGFETCQSDWTFLVNCFSRWPVSAQLLPY